jgi:F0F1-type ATP synthase epsilon subunit
MKRTLIKVTFFAAILMILGGCATVEQLNEVRAIAENAQSAASSAASAASSAASAADSATSTANSAASAASAAQSAADAALACCNENSSKLDRMFEKAMQK